MIDQVIILFAAVNGYLDVLPLDSILPFRNDLVARLKALRPDLYERVEKERTIDDSITAQLAEVIQSIVAQNQ